MRMAMDFKGPDSRALSLYFILGRCFTRQRLCLVLPFTENFSPMVLRPQSLVIIEATLMEAHSLSKASPSLFLIFLLRNTHSSQLFVKQR